MLIPGNGVVLLQTRDDNTRGRGAGRSRGGVAETDRQTEGRAGEPGEDGPEEELTAVRRSGRRQAVAVLVHIPITATEKKPVSTTQCDAHGTTETAAVTNFRS
jgi:hypothetical protein